MKIKDLIEELKQYNPEAEVTAVSPYFRTYLFSVGAEGSNGSEKHNTEEVVFYLYDPTQKQQTNS